MPRLLALCLALLLGCAAPRVRALAEWEPAEGVLVAYPFQVPPQLLRELARDVLLFVLIPKDAPASRPDPAASAQAALAEAGVDPWRATFLPTTVQTAWPRDYGPFTVEGPDGGHVLVDADYIETPIFAADAPPVRKGQELRYPGRSPGDDRTPIDLAAFFRLPRDELPAFVTGGNFLVDGHGTAFATTALLDENRTRMEDDQLRALLRWHLGITRLVVLDNVEEMGIQHIDCWLKLLDAQTLLVKRAPAGHFEHDRIERNVARLQELTGPDGTPYRILRIDCPPFRKLTRKDLGKAVDDLAAYTNSLLLGRRVFVPLFGIPADEAALATYRSALPGHEVVGVPYPGWKGFDALHCRTRAVFRQWRSRRSGHHLRSVTRTRRARSASPTSTNSGSNARSPSVESRRETAVGHEPDRHSCQHHRPPRPGGTARRRRSWPPRRATRAGHAEA